MPYFPVPLLLAMLTLPCSAAVSEHRIVCPAEVSRKTLAITAAPEGWSAFVPFEYQPGLPLNSAGVMYGPPQTMLIAKPSYVGKTKGKGAGRGFSTWDDLGVEGVGEKWIACYYGDNGQHDAILSKRLDGATTACTVTYPQKKSSNAIDIVCQW